MRNNMKHTSIFKIFTLTVFAFVTVSCSGLYNKVGEDEAQKTDKAYISIKVDESVSRTIFSDAFNLLDSNISFELTGTGDKNQTVKKEWASYQAMMQDKFEVEVGTYRFTLTATYSNQKVAAGGTSSKEVETVVFEDTIEEIELKSGQNTTLEFTLEEKEFYLTGQGSVDVTVKFPSDSGANYVVLSFYDFDDYPTGAVLKDADNNPLEWQFATEDIVDSVTGDVGLITSDSTGRMSFQHTGSLDSGKYVMKISFFRDNTKNVEIKPGYSESVIVRSGRPSTKTIEIEALDKLHSIKYVTDTIDDGNGDTTEPQGVELERIYTFNEHQNVTLPTANDIPCIGYTFGGWYEDKDFSGTVISGWDAGEKTADVTFYAKWIPKTDTKYTVEHYQQNIDDDSYTKIEADTENKTGTTAATTTAEAKTYEGFDCVGTDKTNTESTVEQETIAANGSTVIKIYYNRKEITITIDPEDGTEAVAIKGKYGATVAAQTAPGKVGYEFKGWVDKDDKAAEIPTTFPAENATYTANWELITYTITYELNGGTNAANPEEYTIESEITLTDPTRTGYKFVGWYETEDFSSNAKTEIPTGTTGNITLYAKWTPQPSGSIVLEYNNYDIALFTSDGKELPSDNGVYQVAPMQKMKVSLVTPSTRKEVDDISGWVDASSITLYQNGDEVDKVSAPQTGASTTDKIATLFLPYDAVGSGYTVRVTETISGVAYDKVFPIEIVEDEPVLAADIIEYLNANPNLEGFLKKDF